MMVEQIDYIDNLVPTIMQDPHTRKVNAVNRDFFKVERKRISALPEEPTVEGPCIMFYLPDMRQPIEFWNTAVIILGRKDKHNGFIPTLDLSEHHGALLGVSRKHARIEYRDGCYFVSDLGSTNGTWVNEQSVAVDEEVRLSAGDSLRLGHLIIQIGGCGSLI